MNWLYYKFEFLHSDKVAHYRKQNMAIIIKSALGSWAMEQVDLLKDTY